MSFTSTEEHKRLKPYLYQVQFVNSRLQSINPEQVQITNTLTPHPKPNPRISTQNTQSTKQIINKSRNPHQSTSKPTKNASIKTDQINEMRCIPSWTSSPAARSPNTCENLHSRDSAGDSTPLTSPPFIFPQNHRPNQPPLAALTSHLAAPPITMLHRRQPSIAPPPSRWSHRWKPRGFGSSIERSINLSSYILTLLSLFLIFFSSLFFFFLFFFVCCSFLFSLELFYSAIWTKNDNAITTYLWEKNSKCLRHAPGTCFPLSLSCTLFLLPQFLNNLFPFL